MTYANCIKDSNNDIEQKRKRCMLLLMLLFRASYLLLFIWFPSAAYWECRRTNTLHNEDIRANFFSCSMLYREISLLILRHYLVVDSYNKKREVITTFLLLFFSIDLRRVSSSILVYLTVLSCLFSLPW